MNKHTPGQWITGSADNHSRRVILGPTNGISRVIIARMPGEYRENHAVWPTVEANANLIAAAPAMYEALKALVDVFPSVVRTTPYGVSMDISKLHDNAKAALQQAEGR